MNKDNVLHKNLFRSSAFTPSQIYLTFKYMKAKRLVDIFMLNSGQVKLAVGTGLLFSYFMRVQPSLPLSTHPIHFATPQPKDQRQFPKEGEPERHSQPVSAEVKEIRKLENSKTASVCMEDPQLSSCRYSYNTGKHTPILPNTCALTYHIAPSRKGTLTN